MKKNTKKKIIISFLVLLLFSAVMFVLYNYNYNYNFNSIFITKGKGIINQVGSGDAYSAGYNTGKNDGNSAYGKRYECWVCDLMGEGACGEDHYNPQIEWGPGNSQYRDEYAGAYENGYMAGYESGWNESKEKFDQIEYENAYYSAYNKGYSAGDIDRINDRDQNSKDSNYNNVYGKNEAANLGYEDGYADGHAGNPNKFNSIGGETPGEPGGETPGEPGGDSIDVDVNVGSDYLYRESVKVIEANGDGSVPALAWKSYDEVKDLKFDPDTPYWETLSFEATELSEQDKKKLIIPTKNEGPRYYIDTYFPNVVCLHTSVHGKDNMGLMVGIVDINADGSITYYNGAHPDGQTISAEEASEGLWASRYIACLAYNSKYNSAVQYFGLTVGLEQARIFI